MNKIIISVFLLVSISSAFQIEQEFNIKTIKVEAKNIAPYKEFYGKIHADKARIYDIVMRFDGFITKLHQNEPFKKIKKGEKLFSIYSETIYNLYDELAIAKNRSKHLYRSIKKKFHLYSVDSKNRLGDSIVIKSNYAGFITSHNVNEGAYIRKGQKLFEVTDLSTVWALIYIYQKDAEFVEDGMEVEVFVDGLKKGYKGVVEQVYPNVDARNQTFIAKVSIKNEEIKLFPNMFVKAKIYEKAQNIIVIPKNALIQRDGKQYVFFKDENLYTPSEVQAKRIPEGYQIIQGLDVGDEIVTNALFLLDSDAVTNGLYSDDW